MFINLIKTPNSFGKMIALLILLRINANTFRNKQITFMEQKMHLQVGSLNQGSLQKRDCHSKEKKAGAYVKDLEKKNEQLAMMLIEKIGSACMQLNIVMAMLTARDAKEKQRKRNPFLIKDLCEDNETPCQKQNNKWEQQVISNNQADLQKQQLSLKVSTQQNSFCPQASASYFLSTPSPQAQLLKLQALSSTITDLQSKMGIFLIQQQIRLQQEHQKIQQLAVYERRILDMSELLVVKQNDMAVEHLGGNYEQKMKMQHFRRFQEQCIETWNIKAMRGKAGEIQKQIKAIEKKGAIAEQHPLREIQNMDDVHKQISGLESARASKGKENILDIIIARQSQNKPKSLHRIGTFNDPFFRRIIRIFKQEQSKEVSLKQEYRDLRNKLNQVKTEHRKLVGSYIEMRNI